MTWRTVACLCLLAAGCSQPEEDSMTVPRGATISVRTAGPISTQTHKTGDEFSGEIDLPLRQGTTIYVPILSRVDGVVAESSVEAGNENRGRLSLRLTRLHLPSGETIKLDTVPLVKEIKEERPVEDVTVRTGLDVDIDELLGTLAPEIGLDPEPTAEERLRVLVDREAPLVFTLREDVVIPAP